MDFGGRWRTVADSSGLDGLQRSIWTQRQKKAPGGRGQARDSIRLGCELEVSVCQVDGAGQKVEPPNRRRTYRL